MGSCSSKDSKLNTAFGNCENASCASSCFECNKNEIIEKELKEIGDSIVAIGTELIKTELHKHDLDKSVSEIPITKSVV